MAKLVTGIEPRDADTPGFIDISLDLPKVARRLRGDDRMERLRKTLEMDNVDVIRQHTPGAYVDPETGKVEINAGYDPRADAGALEETIWSMVSVEVEALCAAEAKTTAARKNAASELAA